MIGEDEDSLKRCQAEINRLRGVVETLEKEKIRLEKRIQQQRALIHPMRRVPVELLEIIFSYVCFDPIRPLLDVQGYNWFPLHAPPLLLSHTSSHWRTVITHCPRLWSTITVSVDGHKHDIRPLLKLYLSNSAGYPLQIEVKALKSCDGPEEALELMGETWCQWLSVWFSRIWQHNAFNWKTPEDDDTPELPEDMVSEAVTWFWDALRLRAPNLTRLYTGRMLLAHADPISTFRLISNQSGEKNDIARGRSPVSEL
ncbi:hypothetical protein MPER_06377 [Moniliophthora perniciosa FA553]|nr:hypothetical protein MPER_06377 [Moniliophthora perniciosa FA553]